MVPPIEKVSSGISGLDEVLEGGLPRSRVTLVEGGPGSGKTVIGSEFVYAGAVANEPGILVSFEESAEAIRTNATSLGWDLAGLEQQNRLAILDGRVPPDAVPAGEYELSGLLAVLAGTAKRIGARRIAIDAIDLLLYLFPNVHREENALYALHHWLLDQELTAVLTIKNKGIHADSTLHRFLEYMTDCVLRLDQGVQEQVSTRRLRVIKYRGSGHGRNEHPFIIGAGGVTVLPVTSMELRHMAPGPAVSTGIDGLDALLAGGYRRGTAVMISGPSGVGKTTVAASFTASACQEGDRVLYVNLEQSKESLVSCMLSPGIDLHRHIQAGRLQISTSLPESAGVEEHLLSLLKTITSFAPHHMVIDAVSACRRMGSGIVVQDPASQSREAL
jgi:circadian clock protein KaiC